MTGSALTNALLIAAGGAIGCLCRYYVQEADLFNTDKYYYTLAINIVGCLMIGIVWALFLRGGVGDAWRMFLITGVLGGYTTYSSFTLDGVLLLRDGLTLRFLLYVSVTFFGGLAACAAGLYGTEKLCKMFC